MKAIDELKPRMEAQLNETSALMDLLPKRGEEKAIACESAPASINRDHVYVRGGIGTPSIVTRVALASLGPASPPD